MNPMVTIKMNTGKEIKIELYEEVAPNNVRNFVSLVKKGFYDGLKFHRVIPGFMIQGGCPQGVGVGGPGHHIKGEFKANGFQNDLVHDEGVISMARSQHNDSAGSQFFLMTKKSPHLDGQYAAFGKVVEGLENALEIVKVERDHRDMPKIDQVMESVTVENADDMAEPETIS